MAAARFSIGIDLGTSNSAMAFVPLVGDAPTEVFGVPQWEGVSSLVEAPILPSFLYLPEEQGTAGVGAATGEAWIVGRLARKRAADSPGRVAHSAKSWLCHHAADRRAPFLPWGSDEVLPASKISPVHAAALILNFLRGAWNNRFAAAGADFGFDEQIVTITVPASFDAAAQRLTLEAAADAGFPETVRLLEEPQAAFYRWLEAHEPRRDLLERLPGGGATACHVLVVDIGGGTSDFSLFEVRDDGGAVPAMTRIAVSDHLLLGGDNVDLALAHLVEPRVSGDGGGLTGSRWETLVARCRDLKEAVLSTEGAPDQSFAISVAGRGSGLVAGAVSVRVTRAEVEGVLFDGFFPECAGDDRPLRRQVALKEWGLPFVADGAVTRHLADFLRQRPRVDALLFNGGSLYPNALRLRLSRLIGRWQGGAEPLILENAEPDLAVARGAAWYCKLLHRKAARIAAGAGRAVFLSAHRAPAGEGRAGEAAPALICILPRGAPPEQTFDIEGNGLALRLNRPVRFEVMTSSRHGAIRAGDIVEWRPEEFVPLPPLQTVARLAETDDTLVDRTVPVMLRARQNELGLLQVACVSRDPVVPQSWPLEFNLRPHEDELAGGGMSARAAVPVEPNVEPRALALARERLVGLFSRPLQKRDKLSAARVLKSLEDILDLPKAEWNWALVRALWPDLESCMAHRALSVEHEEAWLGVAGFLLRPGSGAPLDESRIDGLWRLRLDGLAHPGKRIKLQEFILWRRVASGLSGERQERIVAPESDRLRGSTSAPAELVLLAGAFERLGIATKTDLARCFIRTAAHLAASGQHCAPYLAALGLMLNRAPLYAGPEVVVSADVVAEAFDAFAKLDWANPELAELQTLFLRAARVVDNRSLDLPKGLRERIAAKLERIGVAPLKTAKLRHYMPLERSERLGLHGESLPPGLILDDNPEGGQHPDGGLQTA